MTESGKTFRGLIVLTTWPSREHPYLIHLYSKLTERLPGFQLYLFKKSGDMAYADELIGERQRRNVLLNAIYRLNPSRPTLTYFAAFVRLLVRPAATLKVFSRCRREAYSIRKSIAQILVNYQLVGKRYDLVYVNALQTAKHLCLRAFFPDAVVIVSSRGQDFDWFPDRYDVVLSSVDHLHVLGNHLRKRAIERGFPQDRITIIPPAVLPVTIEQSNGQNEEDKETFIVATAARLIWTKGYAYALRAIAALRDHLYGKVDIRYIVMGDGAEFEFLEFERRRLGLEMNVEFTGWLNQLEVARRIKEADVYLLLSIEEGFNNSVMLAQSLGIPCIVSDAGGLPENVVDGVTGFVVPRYSVSAASEKLLILCQDGDLRHQLGENARIRMNSEFSLENQVNRYCDLLNSYIGKS